jgi:ketosteroid isomerase-like protein
MKYATLIFSLIVNQLCMGQSLVKQKPNTMDQNIFYDFVNAINGHNVDKLYALMSNDHQFIDAQGNRVTGKDKMKAGWAGYFQWFPDYNIEVTDVFVKGDKVAAFGFAEGSFKGKSAGHWRVPASWKAVIENNKVTVWQVYADTKIPFDIINSNK